MSLTSIAFSGSYHVCLNSHATAGMPGQRKPNPSASGLHFSSSAGSIFPTRHSSSPYERHYDVSGFATAASETTSGAERTEYKTPRPRFVPGRARSAAGSSAGSMLGTSINAGSARSRTISVNSQSRPLVLGERRNLKWHVASILGGTGERERLPL